MGGKARPGMLLTVMFLHKRAEGDAAVVRGADSRLVPATLCTGSAAAHRWIGMVGMPSETGPA